MAWGDDEFAPVRHADSMWVRGRGKGLFPFQTKRAPAELNMLLPALVFAARDGDEATLQTELVETSALLEADVKAHTMALSGMVASAFCVEAMGGLPISQQDRDGLWPWVVEVAQQMPVTLDEGILRRWLDQVSGGERTLKYSGAAEFDLPGLSCFVAIAGAAARSRSLSDEEVLTLYRLARKTYEHTTFRYK